MYRLLPSEVRSRATAYDIMVFDVYTAWENHKNQGPGQEELKNILEQVKNGR